MAQRQPWNNKHCK
uniref:Uncharacterized protein n=1 Tax=Vitis vinifera TaxID=29760 RepID=F6I3F0_VITVI